MLDYLFIAIIIISVVFSAVRGFFRELELVVSFLSALIVAYFLGSIISTAIISAIGMSIFVSIITYAVVFFATLVAVQLLANSLLDNFEVGDGINMLFGALIGFIKGWVLVVVISLATFSASLDSINFIKNSYIRSMVKEYTGLQALMLNMFKFDYAKAINSVVEQAPSIVEPNTVIEQNTVVEPEILETSKENQNNTVSPTESNNSVENSSVILENKDGMVPPVESVDTKTVNPAVNTVEPNQTNLLENGNTEPKKEETVEQSKANAPVSSN